MFALGACWQGARAKNEPTADEARLVWARGIVESGSDQELLANYAAIFAALHWRPDDPVLGKGLQRLARLTLAMNDDRDRRQLARFLLQIASEEPLTSVLADEIPALKQMAR